LTVTANKNEIQKIVLDNGITLLVVENQAADLIAARLFLKAAGTRYESSEKAGLSHLVASVITKGTVALSSAEIAEKIESVGASLGADTAADYFLLGLKTVSADFPVILRLAGEILRQPSFPEAEVQLEKNLTLQSIRSQQEQPFNIAFSQLRRSMYRSHPYGFSVLGEAETVNLLTRDDLCSYHQSYFRPDNLIVSISGKISTPEALQLVKDIFGDWQVPTNPLPSLQLPDIVNQPIQAREVQNTQQAVVMLGYLAAAVDSEDYSALKLLSTYLGNGLSSRLFVELREKRGLAYDVSAIYPTRLDRAQFVAYMGTAPENTQTAIDGLRYEIDRLRTTILTTKELQTAKNKLLGQYALGKQTNADLAQTYGWYESIGLGLEFDRQFQTNIAAVDAETVLEVAERYFVEPYLSVVGPE
jgi:zinc protease